jgi:hypothetical protein
MADPVCMTLAEAAKALNTTPDALRKKIRRGTLKAARDNTGRLLVWVDPDAEPCPPATGGRLDGTAAGRVDGASSRVHPPESAQDAYIQTLKEQLDALRADYRATFARLTADVDRARLDADRERQLAQALLEQVKDLTDRLDQLHREWSAEAADRARLETQIAADAEHRARLEMDVAGLQTELEQDRARITTLTAEGHHQAEEIDRLQAKLAQPWWRRLLRR